MGLILRTPKGSAGRAECNSTPDRKLLRPQSFGLRKGVKGAGLHYPAVGCEGLRLPSACRPDSFFFRTRGATCKAASRCITNTTARNAAARARPLRNTAVRSGGIPRTRLRTLSGNRLGSLRELSSTPHGDCHWFRLVERLLAHGVALGQTRHMSTSDEPHALVWNAPKVVGAINDQSGAEGEVAIVSGVCAQCVSTQKIASRLQSVTSTRCVTRLGNESQGSVRGSLMNVNGSWTVMFYAVKPQGLRPALSPEGEG